MAFFTRSDSNVPFLPTQDECHSTSNTLKRSSTEDKPAAVEKCCLSRCEDIKQIKQNGLDDDSIVNGDEDAIDTDQRFDYVVDRVLGVEV